MTALSTTRCGRWLCALTAAIAMIGSSANAADAPLLKNSNLETDADGDGWPDHWSKLKENGSWEVEGGNHFIRMKTTVPDKLVMLLRIIDIPAGTKALELAWRWRVTDLKPGKLPWNDARMMLEFVSASGAKLSPQPSHPIRVAPRMDGRRSQSASWCRKARCHSS